MPGYNNGDFAVNLGSNLPQLENISNQLYERGLRRQAEQDRLAREQQSRQDMLTKYVGDQFDNKDYLSGTERDPHINDLLKASLQKHADMIRKNPDISMADLSYSMAGDAANIHSISQKAKIIGAGIDDNTKEFDKEKGIDGKAISQMAKMMAFNTLDPKTGKWMPKADSEIDPSKDYVRDVIDQHPDKYLNEGAVLDNYVKTAPMTKEAKDFQTDHAGIRRDKSYDVNMYPWQSIVKDAKGNPVLNSAGNVQTAMQSHVEKGDDGKPLYFNGKPLEVMDNHLYNQWISDPARNAVLIKKLNDTNAQQAAQGKPTFKNGTPEAELIKNNALHEILSGIAPKEFKTTDKTNEDTWKAKQDAGLGAGLTAVARAIAAQNKANQKLEGTDFGRVLRALGGGRAELEGAQPTAVDGKQMFDITNTVGGMKLGTYKDADGKVKVDHAQAIIVDPLSKTLYIKDEQGNTKGYYGLGIRKKFKQISDFNGVNGDKIHQLLGMHISQDDGKFVGKQDSDHLAEIGALQDVAKKKADERATVINNKVESAINGKDVNELSGITLPEGKVTDIGQRGVSTMFGSAPYYLEVTGAGGKKRKIDFTDEEKMKEYLKKNAK